jgi:signal transduction histidine kinase
MDSQGRDSAEQIKHLQRCINDLISLLALPAVWSGNEPIQIVQMLLDALLRMLNLDFAFARLNHPVTTAPLEFFRVADSCQLKMPVQAIFEMLNNCLRPGGNDSSAPPTRSRFEEQELSVLPVPLGIHGQIGMIVVGSERTDFPSQTESLLLSVAANQASIGLREASLLREQKQIANELDRRVMERTAQLASANAELSKEIVDRKVKEEQLRRSEAFLAEGQHLARIGSFSWLVETDEIKWSEQLYRIFEFEFGTTVTLDLIGSRVHPEDRPLMYDMVEKAQRAANDFEYPHRLLMPDGSIKHLHLVAHATRNYEGRLEYIGAVQDVTQRRLSEEALSKARSELVKVASITSLGVLTASIAHEVNQPLSGIITNASTCLRMLSADPPNVDGARETVRRTIRDGNRAADVISRLRTLYSKKEPSPEPMDMNEATREVIALSLTELQRNGVMLRYELAEDLSPVVADRIQIQQVILNLLRNATEAMSTVDERPRELFIRTERDGRNRVQLSVKDSGIGFNPPNAVKIFDAFYTTKSDGMGVGLSISRSIIEAHQGSLWASPNDGPGSTFSFVIPCRAEEFVDSETGNDRTDPATNAA